MIIKPVYYVDKHNFLIYRASRKGIARTRKKALNRRTFLSYEKAIKYRKENTTGIIEELKIKKNMALDPKINKLVCRYEQYFKLVKKYKEDLLQLSRAISTVSPIYSGGENGFIDSNIYKRYITLEKQLDDLRGEYILKGIQLREDHRFIAMIKLRPEEHNGYFNNAHIPRVADSEDRLFLKKIGKVGKKFTKLMFVSDDKLTADDKKIKDTLIRVVPQLKIVHDRYNMERHNILQQMDKVKAEKEKIEDLFCLGWGRTFLAQFFTCREDYRTAHEKYVEYKMKLEYRFKYSGSYCVRVDQLKLNQIMFSKEYWRYNIYYIDIKKNKFLPVKYVKIKQGTADNVEFVTDTNLRLWEHDYVHIVDDIVGDKVSESDETCKYDKAIFPFLASYDTKYIYNAILKKGREVCFLPSEKIRRKRTPK